MANMFEKADFSNLTMLKKAIEGNIKLLYLDIETTPMISYHYGTRKLFISPAQIKQHVKVSSIVLMWEFDRKPLSFCWDADNKDDTAMLREVTPMLNKADLIVMQNGDRFDVPTLQARLCDLKLPSLKNIITFDTLKASRRSFMRPHHSLDSRSNLYGLGGKLPRDWDRIIAIAEGDKKALKEDIKYNLKDVTDMRSIMMREFNYYNLPQRFLNTLKMFNQSEDKPYCIKCAARRQSKFKISFFKEKNKQGINVSRCRCTNCMYEWTPRKLLTKAKRK